MEKNKIIKNFFEPEEPKYEEVYSEEILIACQNGKPCSYGICDECPNTLGNEREDNEDDND